ncbi:hypothetical protein FQA39_LY16933 [Lamprigera yunnana]|nr:hypothetical protein FQA39_LY16933 [Lamprigera yunnana]
MPGEVLNSQSQMFVIKLLQYFEQEKENGGPLISVLSVQQQVTPEIWSNTVTKTENLIMDYWQKLQNMRKHCVVNNIVINLAEDDETDSENENSDSENDDECGNEEISI